MNTLRTTVLAAAFAAAFLAGPAFAAGSTVESCGPAPQSPGPVQLISHQDVSSATAALNAFGTASTRYASCVRMASADLDEVERAAVAAELNRLNFVRQRAAIELTRAVRNFRQGDLIATGTQVAGRN